MLQWLAGPDRYLHICLSVRQRPGWGFFFTVAYPATLLLPLVCSSAKRGATVAL